MTVRFPAAALLAIASIGAADACQLDVPLDENGNRLQPVSWEAQIDRAPVVFVGRVVEIAPSAKPGWPDRVLLDVELPIKGDVGASFEASQGSGGDCGKEFAVGQRVIFAGDLIWDPTVYLSEPLTANQARQLAYVEAFAEE